MKPIYRCLAGIDVHKAMLAVVVRREAEGGVEYQKRKFGTMASEIAHLAAWLQREQVSEVVMESTAQYWRPVWYGLEAHFRLHLCHPLKVRARRGRKSDFKDAERLTNRWHSGDLEESFVPGAEQRGWRWLTRRRVQLQRMIGLIRNQVEGLLEQGSIKLTAVASDPFGVSGWAMLQHLANGETDVTVLVAEARGALRKKEDQLREALAGKLEPIYQTLLRQSLEQVEMLRQQIEQINGILAEQMQAQVGTLQRLTKIPGVDLWAAQELLAEIGVGATMFPTAGCFASWVGVCPGSHESAGVNYSPRSAKGNRYLRRLLCQVAWGAIHTKDTFFAGLFARYLPRLEAKGANWAIAHRMAKLIWLMLTSGVEYHEQGPAIANPRNLRRKFRRLVQELARAGLDPQQLLAASAAAPA